eukprot:2467756-Amphidinium_carterae.1
MITHGRAWDSCRLGTTAMCPGMNRYLWLYGSSAAGMPLTGIMYKMVVTGAKTFGAVFVTGQEAMIGRLADVVPVVLGLAPSTWFRRHAWMVTSRCAPFTRSWSTKWIATSRGYAASGSNNSSSEAWLRRPNNQGKYPRGMPGGALQLRCRPKGKRAWLRRHCWLPMVRIGEAKNPGPL